MEVAENVLREIFVQIVLQQIRQVELQFTVGEALSCVGAGRLSEVAQDSWAVEQLSSGEHDDKTMQELIDVIVNKYANSGIPYVRQVSKQV